MVVWPHERKSFLFFADIETEVEKGHVAPVPASLSVTQDVADLVTYTLWTGWYEFPFDR